MPDNAEERCVKAEVIPSRGSWLDYVQAKCVMHFPTQPDYEFSFYDDEIHFSPSELEGLTRSEAMDLYAKKDIAYIRG